MANSSRNARKVLKDFEEEEINRRLKAADLFNHLDSYETRKQIAGLLQESAQEHIGIKKKNKTNKNHSLGSFKDGLHVEDGNIEIETAPESLSARQREKFDRDDTDEEVLPSAEKAKITRPVKNYGPLSKKHVESYGNKMLAASFKKSEDNEDPIFEDSTLTQEELLEPSNKKSKLSNLGKAALNSDNNGQHSRAQSKESALYDLIEDDDEDFIPSSLKETVKMYSTSSLHPVISRVELSALKMNSKKYSEILQKLERMSPPHPLPTTYDFKSKGSHKKLLEEEREQEEISEGSSCGPMKWPEPVLLSISNVRKRRPISNPTSRGSSPKREFVQVTDPLICDSPPALPQRKLDSSPQSPVLEPESFRRRSSTTSRTEKAVDSDVEFEFEENTTIDKNSTMRTQECPICTKYYPLDSIEDHASGCYGNEKDEIFLEQRPRSERITTRSYRMKQSRHNSESKRFDDEAGSSRHLIHENSPSEMEDSESDFEIDGDSKSKRNRKRDSTIVKKRRM